MNRREFLTAAGAVGVAPVVGGRSVMGQATPGAQTDRAYWVSVMTRLADPVLTNLANGTLKARMPVEQAAGSDRRAVTHLEALGRLVAGMAPWIELAADDTPEGKLRGQYADLARRAIARAVDPASPDFLNFTRERQPLVDAAFLAQGVLRAPRALKDALGRDRPPGNSSPRSNQRARSRRSSATGCCFPRPSKPRSRASAPPGTGCASTTRCGSTTSGTRATASTATAPRSTGTTTTASSSSRCCSTCSTSAATRCPPGRSSRPASNSARGATRPFTSGSSRRTGRSRPSAARSPIALARSSCSRRWRCARRCPKRCRRRRCAAPSPRVIRRTIEAPGTFDANGWLQIGFCGHQPGVGETYISTGSLYLCAVGLLPLGLPPADPFWSAPAAAVDIGPRVVGPAVPDRPRAGDLTSGTAAHPSRRWMSTMTSASSSWRRSAPRMNPAGRFFEPDCRIHATCTICM